MKVVVFSTDRNILNPSSAVSARQRAYAAQFDAYDVVIRREWFSLRIVRLVRAADVISSQDPFETGLIAWKFSVLFRKPLHVQVHTDFYARGFVQGHPILNRIRRALAPFILRRATRIRVVSETIKESIEKHIAPHAPLTVLPIFVDTARLHTIVRMKHTQFKIALLVVSRLEKEKNVALALTALKAARDSGHDAGLTIVGSGSQMEALKAYAHTLNLERYVVFAGETDPLSHYASADAVLVPSLYEGYGMVIVEALAAGIPVIATDVGIAREAGAMVTSEKDFPQTVVRWIKAGPRQASLATYPYSNLEDYVQKYCDDIKQTIRD